MSKLDLEHIGDLEFDVLREIGNIGAGNAMTALSQMVDLRIDMKVPKVELLEFKELSDSVGGAESLVVGILLTLEGDIDGMMMFMMDKRSARHIVNLLMNHETNDLEVEEFSEMDLSALQEIGNIIAGAYLSSLSQLTNMTITSSVPYMSIDMAGAILSVPAIEFGKISDKALLIQSQFGEKEKEINDYFILIPSMNSYEKIMSSLGL